MRARVLEGELMDDPGLDPGVHRRALRALARLNRLSGSAAIMWRGLRDLAPPRGASPLRVLDVATGAGDVPVALAQRARRARRAVVVDGCDLSPVALDVARSRAREHGIPSTFLALDVTRDPLPDGYDVVTCSLFLHHLADGDAVALLAAAGRAAGRRLLVNDLERGRVNLGLVSAGATALGCPALVRTDAGRSVRAAFTRAELTDLGRTAGLEGAVVSRRFPCRMLLTWNRP